MGQALLSHRGYSRKHNTQKPQVQSLTQGFPKLFFLPDCSPQHLLVSFFCLLFLQRTYYLMAYHFFSFIYIYFFSFFCLCFFLSFFFLSLSFFFFCSFFISLFPLFYLLSLFFLSFLFSPPFLSVFVSLSFYMLPTPNGHSTGHIFLFSSLPHHQHLKWPVTVVVFYKYLTDESLLSQSLHFLFECKM